jgi:hypothetical protein
MNIPVLTTAAEYGVGLVVVMFDNALGRTAIEAGDPPPAAYAMAVPILALCPLFLRQHLWRPAESAKPAQAAGSR